MDGERERVVEAAAFAANCLDFLDQVASGRLDRVTVIGSGRPVTVLEPSRTVADVAALHGYMAGRVTITDGFDPTEPALASAELAEWTPFI